MAEEIKIKLLGTNDAYNINNRGIVKIRITCDTTQLSNVMRMFNLIGREFKVGVGQHEEKKIKKLGLFTIENIRVDGDGESKVTLRGDTESVKAIAVAELYEQYREEMVDFRIIG